MQQRTLIIATVVLVAIVGLLSVAIVAGLYLTGGQTYDVPVARTEIPSNTRIQEQHIQMKTLDDEPPQSVLRDKGQVVGKVSTDKIASGDQFKPDMLSDKMKVVRTTESIAPGNTLKRDQVEIIGVEEPPSGVATDPSEVVDKLVKNGIPANTLVKVSDVYQSMQQVVIPREQVEANSIIRSDQVRVVSKPSANVPPDALSNADEVTGRASKRKLGPGDVIRESDLFPAKNQLSFFIPLYRRAVSVAISNYNNLSYLLRPGDKVDLYVYMHQGLSGMMEGEGAVKLSPRPTLQKVADAAEIITLNDVFTQQQVEKIESGGNGKKGGGKFTYQEMTLAVTLTEAEKINLIRGFKRDEQSATSKVTRFFAVLRPRQSDSKYANRSVNMLDVFNRSIGRKHDKVSTRINNQVYDAGMQQTYEKLNGKNVKIIRGNQEENVMVPRK